MIIPNGKLIAAGGAINRDTGIGSDEVTQKDSSAYLKTSILRRVIEEAGGVDARIEIITTASSRPHKAGDDYLKSFNKLGCANVGIIHIRTHKEILAAYLERINKCNCVMFTGGTQRRLASVFQNTELLEAIVYRYQHEKLSVFGTSAGAMVMGKILIYKGTAPLTYLKGNVKTMDGFNLISQVIFDSHFEKAGRFIRLAQVIAANPAYIGVGLGEDTGVLITNGNHIQVIGNGLVTIIDGYKIHHTNAGNISDGFPINVENLKVHFSIEGDEYILNKRTMIAGSIASV